MANPKMLVAVTLGTVIVVGAIIATATNNWLILPIAVVVHFVVSAFVIGFFFKKIEEGDKPDPVTAAHMEAGDIPAQKRDGLTDSGRRDDQEVVL